jgi:plastocyanin
VEIEYFYKANKIMQKKQTIKKVIKKMSGQINKKIIIIGGGILLILSVSIVAALVYKDAKIDKANRDAASREEARVSLFKDARMEATGANKITSDGVVITPTGEQVLTNVAQGSILAPIQTGPLVKEELASNAINLDAGSNSFSPSEFTVKAGEPVTLAITSIDDSVHSLVFEDSSLQAVVLGVLAGETKAITFNAPSVKGEYNFYSAVEGHKEAGETGKMIVE